MDSRNASAVESPGFITISVISKTSAIAGRLKNRDVVPGNRRCNTRVCHRAAEKAPASAPHNSRRWRYTFGAIRSREPCRPLYWSSPVARDSPACVRRGTPGSGSGHWSVPGLHKIPARDGKRKGLIAVAAIQGLIGQWHLFLDSGDTLTEWRWTLRAVVVCGALFHRKL